MTLQHLYDMAGYYGETVVIVEGDHEVAIIVGERRHTQEFRDAVHREMPIGVAYSFHILRVVGGRLMELELPTIIDAECVESRMELTS